MWRLAGSLVWLALAVAAPAAAQIQDVALLPPARDFGYFIGDTMTATVNIRVAPGTTLDRSALPTPGAVAAALDVRQVTATQIGQQLQLRIEYQTFVAPEEAMQVRVPAYTLVFHQGARSFEAHVPYWSFYTSPFRHEHAAVTDPAVLRTDHALQPFDLRWQQAALLVSAAVAGIAVLALAQRRGWTPRMGLRLGPFARACRDVARADRAASLLALHRAFDATAGRSLLAEDVDPFLDAHPAFLPLRTEIEGFFGLSRDTFYAGAPLAPTARPPDLPALARRLRRAERMA